MSLQEIAKEGPSVFAEVLRQLHGIEYFVFSGTALGLYRDGDLIPTDTDIDFVIEKSRSSIAELRKRLSNCAVKWESDHQVTFIHPKGVVIDFLFFRGCAEGWVFEVPHPWKIKKECFDSVDFRKTKYGIVRFPMNVEYIFAKKYGEDWRTPKFQGKATWVK